MKSNLYNILLKEYNEKNWQDYCNNLPKSNVLRPESIAPDIWRALVFNVGEHASLWMEKNIPALDNNQPRSLLGTKDGVKILKSFLMRFP